MNSSLSSQASIGVVGTGYIARQVSRALVRSDDCDLAAILTRRNPAAIPDSPCPDRLTTNLADFLSKAELVVECSGDPFHAATVIDAALKRGLPVVTMNSEFHVTCGSYFVDKGYLTEAEGDQPGSLAALAEDARAMGFEPLVYGNMKGFLDPDPSLASMVHWSERLGFSREQVMSFTDGTKLQFEQALVGNGLGASIAKPGMIGVSAEDKSAAQAALARYAIDAEQVISDYILHASLPPGVFIAARHCDAEREVLQAYKQGPGPWYLLERPFHLCGLEVIKTIRRALRGDPPLINNSSRPRISVAAIAKRDLPAGHRINRGIGSADLRGEALLVADHPEHLPLGLVRNATVIRSVAAGRRLSWQDVELPDSLPLRIARELFAA